MLRARATDVIELFETDEYISRLRSVRRSEHPSRMQLIDDSCSATVADLEAPLQERRRPLLVLHDDLGSFTKELVAIARIRGFAVTLRTFERLLLPHGLENVWLDLDRLLENNALRRERSPLCRTTTIIPAHEVLGVLTGQICALQTRWLRRGVP